MDNKLNDLLYLDGYFFITSQALRDNEGFVKDAVQDLYDFITYN